MPGLGKEGMQPLGSTSLKERTQLTCHKPGKTLALSLWKKRMEPLQDCLTPSCVYPRRTKAYAGQGGWVAVVEQIQTSASKPE